MIRKCRSLEMMFRGGWKPSEHGEWIDAYNKSSTMRYAGTIALQTFMANHRFVLIEL